MNTYLNMQTYKTQTRRDTEIHDADDGRMRDRNEIKAK